MSDDGGHTRSMRDRSDDAETAVEDPPFASELDDDLLLEMFVDNTSECFVVVDEQNRILFVNRKVEELFGYSPSELLGERLTELIPPEYRDAHLTAFAEYLRTGDRTLDWESVEFPGWHRDGHEVPLLITFGECTSGDDRYYVGVVRDDAQRQERRERLATEKAFVESVLDALPDVVYAFDESGQFLRWNERAKEVTGYTDEEIASMEPLSFIPERDHQLVAESLNRVMTDGAVETIESALVTKAGTEIPYEFTGAPLIEDGEIIGETGVGRDISERKRREEQLQRLDELNTVIRSVDQTLIDASTPEEIEEAVCEQLVTEGGYEGTVIGGFHGPDDALTVNTSAGVDSTALESGTSADGRESSLAARALRSRSVRVVTDCQGEGSDPDEGDVGSRDYDAVAMIPLVYEDREFGVLAVYSDRPDAFRTRERTILGELGEVVADAIRNALTHQMLYGDTVTEVELRSTDPDNAFVSLSADAHCRLELTRTFTYGDEVVTYFSVTGIDPGDVADVAESFDEFSSVEYLGTGGDEHRFQFVTERGAITTKLSRHGARTVEGTVDDGVANLTVQLPPRVEVRTFVDDVQSTYPETELVGRRDVQRSLQTPAVFWRTLAGTMTEKQQAALEAAYFGGYFEWPARTNSAEDVAEMLDIAPQTFHQHLRVAQEKLLDVLFRETVGENLT